MKTIKVFPDYCSTGLWDESGAETSLEKLNINDPCANLSLKGINKVFEYIEPDDLIPIFDELLEHYKFAALKCHGRAMASPLVIAELVLLGWRNAEDERQPKNSEELI